MEFIKIKKKRRKKSEKTKLNEKVWALMREYVRLRDLNICQKCNKLITDNRDSHPSHVLSQGAYPDLKYDEFNVKLMCIRCHNWWHKNPLDAYKWFKDKFLKRYEYLQQLKQKPVCKLNEAKLEDLKLYYELKIKAMKLERSS